MDPNAVDPMPGDLSEALPGDDDLGSATQSSDEQTPPRRDMAPAPQICLGFGFRAVLLLNGLDRNQVKSRSEIVIPTILLSFVATNAVLAFTYAFLSVEIIFGQVTWIHRLAAGLTIGTVVGLIDWMIICWHPAIPTWFTSGRRTPPPRHTAIYAMVVAACVSGLVLLATWMMSPETAPHVRSFWSLLSGLVSLCFALWIRQRTWSAKPLDPGQVPVMPTGIDKLPAFGIRVLLTISLSLVLGTGISIVINKEAVEAGRRILAIDSATAARQDRLDMEYKRAKDSYDRAVKHVQEINRNREEQLKVLQNEAEKAKSDLKIAKEDYNTALERTKCERNAECSGFAGGSGLQRAIEDEQDASDAKKAAQTNVNNKQDAYDNYLNNNPEKELPQPPEQSTAKPEDLTKEDIELALQAAYGLSATLKARDIIATKHRWPWWFTHGAELLILVLDMIPVLLKLTSGYQLAEVRKWNAECRELEELQERAALRHTQRRTMAKVHEAGAADEIREAKYRAETGILEAQADRDAVLQMTKLIGEAKVRWVEFRISQVDAALIREVKTDIKESSHPSNLDVTDLPFTASIEDNVETREPSPKSRPLWRRSIQSRFPEDRVVTVRGDSYLIGPALSESEHDPKRPSLTYSMNDVHLGVKIPESDVSVELEDATEMVQRCCVIKTRGKDLDISSWREILHRYRDMNLPFDLSDWEPSEDGRLVHRTYYPRGDVKKYLILLRDEKRRLHYKQVAHWGQSLAIDLGRLHGEHRAHNDIKPDNILAAGPLHPMTNGLTEHYHSHLLLADFDYALPVGKRTVYSVLYAAPEKIDLSSRLCSISSYEGDVFGLAATLLYIASGHSVNLRAFQQAGAPSHIQLGNHPVPGWMDFFETNLDRTLHEAFSEVPVPLMDALRAALAPHPESRPTASEFQELLSKAAWSLREQSFIPATRINNAVQPIGMGQPVVSIFQELRYDLRRLL